MGVNKCRDMLGDRVMGTDNAAAGIVGFMDFGEDVKIGGAGIGNVQEGDALG